MKSGGAGKAPSMLKPRPKAVLFDLLSALVDSWSLWDDLAGGEEAGRRWRLEYLELTYGAGAYVPYLELVRESALRSGLDGALADEMDLRWGTLEPWPEARGVLEGLAAQLPLAVVTNCSERLGAQAAAIIGVPFRAVVTAESVGAYKPDPAVYAAGVTELGFSAADVLFVAGSPFDVGGAARAGMRVAWHNRIGLVHDDARRNAVLVMEDLTPLGPLLGH